MSCYHPMIRYEVPDTTEIEFKDRWKKTKEGKWSRKAIIYSEKKIKKMGFNNIEEWIEDQKQHNEYWYDMKETITLIPCRQCIGCRLDYSRQWANRIVLEAKKWKPETCWFLTLTYNDEHIPTKTVKNEITGEIIQANTLKKEDVQRFMKRLRRHYEHHYKHEGIRFFLAGEYGEETNRAHYHACIFNMPIYTELKKYKTNELGQMIWICEEIEKIWGKGFISLGRLTWESAAYTARYILKKQYGKEAEWYYSSKGQEPEFTLMSRAPGIARDYYEENKEKIYLNDEIALPKGDSAIHVKPPKYYDKLYDIEYHENMANVKLNRKYNMEKAMEMQDTRTDISRAERRNIAERTKNDSRKKLIRKL